MATEEFDAGKVAGRIDERLASHDEHFRRINGSVEKHALATEALVLAVERLIEKTHVVETRTQTITRWLGATAASSFMVLACIVVIFGFFD